MKHLSLFLLVCCFANALFASAPKSQFWRSRSTRSVSPLLQYFQQAFAPRPVLVIPTNPYELLGLDQDLIMGMDAEQAKREVIRAHRAQALKWHTDKPGGNNDMIQAVNAAKDQILAVYQTVEERMLDENIRLREEREFAAKAERERQERLARERAEQAVRDRDYDELFAFFSAKAL
jgi:hypothetical protein